MDLNNNDGVKDTAPSDGSRKKKLEAELRATEEIAMIKQRVIEKRLELELAALEQQSPVEGGNTVESQPFVQEPPLVMSLPTAQTKPPMQTMAAQTKPPPSPRQAPPAKPKSPGQATPLKSMAKPVFVQPDPRQPHLFKKVSMPDQDTCIYQKPTTSACAEFKLQKSPFSMNHRRSQEKRSRCSFITPSFLTFTRKHQVPAFFTPLSPEETQNEQLEEVEDEDDDEDLQPKGKNFFKGVISKWKNRRLKSED